MHTVQHHLPRETLNPPCCFLLFVFLLFLGFSVLSTFLFILFTTARHERDMHMGYDTRRLQTGGIPGNWRVGGLAYFLFFFFFFPSYLDLGYLRRVSFSVVYFVLCLYVGSGTLVESPLIICNSCSGSSDKHGHLDGWMEEGCYREEQQMACSGEIALLIRAFSGFLCQLLWRSRAGFQGLQSL
ncbi:hypothetical protein VTI28DRAFT_4014 [Corynascus sepedonium]